jgi:hypothetical protein
MTRLAPSLFVLLLGCGLELPEKDVSYSDHIVPLVKRDCAFCHENGEYNAKLAGEENDYDEIWRFVDPPDYPYTALMAWAAGLDQKMLDRWQTHPVLWPEGSAEHRTVSSWIAEGARRRRIEPEIGQCRDDDDCPPVNCLCEDLSLVRGRTCRVNAGGKGECAKDTNCSDSGFRLCDTKRKRPTTVSFSQHVAPIIKSDCTSCHSKGQFRVRLVGDSSDHSVVMEHVARGNPTEFGGFASWAAGEMGYSHPACWPTSSTKYNLLVEWIDQGAASN